MTLRLHKIVASIAISLAAFAPMIGAQQEPQPTPTWSQDDSLRIIRETQKRLGNLPYYGVFDWITFGIHGKSLVLRGYASRPTLKTNAENALKGIAGVDSIENEIEVLPNSPFDDRIRQAAYTRIYSAASLQKYSGSRGMGRGGPSVARMAGGITNDPPMGYHGISIIVKRGNIILYGVVLNSTDQAIAEMQANQTSGVFSVENNLVVQGAKPKPASK
jgi:hyperosmotically inducible protein